MNRTFLYLFFILCTLKVYSQKEIKVLTVPGKDAYTHIDKNGKTVLPSEIESTNVNFDYLFRLVMK